MFVHPMELRRSAIASPFERAAPLSGANAPGADRDARLGSVLQNANALSRPRIRRDRRER